MTFTSWATGGMIIPSRAVGGWSTPIIRGTEKPKMSASTSPTLRPEAAMAAARLTVTEDLPTPPLPDVTARTRVRLPFWAKGTTRSAALPRSFACSSARCSEFMAPILTKTRSTPSSAPTTFFTSAEMVSRKGQPAVVRRIETMTVPSSSIWTSSTMLRSVIGRRISGSMTRSSAPHTSSRLTMATIVPAWSMPRPGRVARVTSLRVSAYGSSRSALSSSSSACNSAMR